MFVLPCLLILLRSTASADIGIIRTHFSPEEDSLQISFSPSSNNYSAYKLEICRPFGTSPCYDRYIFWEILDKIPFSTQLVGYVHDGSYSIKVTPFKFKTGEMVGLEKDSIFEMVNITNYGVPNCSDWQLHYHLLEGEDKTSLTVLFGVSPLQCLLDSKEVCIVLYQINNRSDITCYGNYLNLIQIERLYSLERIHNESRTKVEFKNLTTGYYVVHIVIKNNKACTGEDCDIYCSNVISIGVQDPEVIRVDDKANKEPDKLTTYIPLYGILALIPVLILVLVAILYVKKFYFSYTQVPQFSTSDLTLDGICELAKRKAQELEVILLYCRDSDEHNDLVAAFSNFLLDCWKLKCLRFENQEEALIMINLHIWVEDVTSDAGNRRFIIVESEGAVRMENGRRNTQLVRPEMEDPLDDIFPYALQLLKSRMNGVWDYNKIFVVKFQYTPEECKLVTLVPRRRYFLIDCLFELYCDILDLHLPSIEFRNTFKDTMRRNWNNFLQENCSPLINITNQTVPSNPLFFGESIADQNV